MDENKDKRCAALFPIRKIVAWDLCRDIRRAKERLKIALLPCTARTSLHIHRRTVAAAATVWRWLYNHSKSQSTNSLIEKHRRFAFNGSLFPADVILSSKCVHAANDQLTDSHKTLETSSGFSFRVRRRARRAVISQSAQLPPNRR